MSKPRIFISHSAKEAKAAEVLTRLIAELEPDFRVLVDQERLRADEDQLVAGQDWRAKLFYWMSQAHGAVILFSESARESDWVRAEASVLAWRRLMDQGKHFALIPALLAPVTPADLEARRFSPLRLTDLQLVRGDDPARVSRQVRAGLAHLLKGRPPETLIEKLERKIARLLRDVDAPELEGAARVLGADPDEWGAGADPKLMLAAEMLRRGLLSVPKVINELDVFLTRDARRELINLVTPTWV
ncbi:MAG: toll/interleukin-1 receptor domain-containing protein, partial [Acidobacteriota bacterium]|nr:toll/interleukin-1 receptor domain-containing protein [Acidobacteriota bacterium]